MPSDHSQTLEPLGHLQAIVVRGGRAEAVAYAQSLHEISALDAAIAEWLMDQARGWHAEGFLAEQRDACELVLKVVPEHFEALHLLGYDAQIRGDYAGAEAYYARALKSRPDFPFSRLAFAQMRMMRSGFAQGRDLYEARFDAVTENSGPDWRGLPIARWRGDPVTEKKLYIWAEQGLGDIIMFAGFLPHLMNARPARVALGMFPKLITLFKRSFPQVEVESIDDAIHHALAPSVMHALPHIETLSRHASVPFSLEPLRASYDYVQRHGLFDFAAPMGDLLVYGLPGYVPARQTPSYLIPDPARLAATRDRLSKMGQGRRIGISWHTTNTREMTRNIPLEEWLPLLSVPDCHFVSLQHHADADDIARFCQQHGCRITVDVTVDPLADAEGLAALIAAMDEVVTIDNSNVHLAGALGVPTLLLLPKGCNYRWPVLENEATLWYSCVTALRQSDLLDWRPVMKAARERVILTNA